jgi:hypothetical protein
MSGGGRPAGPVLALGGVAGTDLFVRVVLDLLYAGDPVAFAVGGGVLATRYVFDATTLTWAFGWVVLGGAVFVVTPEVFPAELLSWARGLLGRTAMTLGVVTVALSFDSAFAALAVFKASPVEPPPLVLLAAVATVFVFIPITFKLPRWCPDVPLVNCPEETLLHTGKPVRFGETLARILLIVPFAALFLVLLSRLFPIPEILLVLLALAEMGRSARSGVSGLASGRKDVVERAVLGLGAVWFGPQAVLALLYAVVPVFFVLYVDLRALEMVTGPLTPRALGFVIATLGVATLGILVASVRLIERLPRACLVEDAGDDVRLAERFEDLHPRVPGLMALPTGLLVVFASQAPTFFQEFSPRPAFTLSVSTVELGIALVLAGLTLIVTLRASWFADLRLLDRDYHAAVASTALFVGVPLGYAVAVGTENQNVATVSLPVLVALVVYALVGLLLSPFLGYELFDKDPDAPDQSRFGLLASEIKTAFLAVVGFSIFSAVVLNPAIVVASAFVSEEIVTLLVGPLVAPITVGLLVRLALILFYLPERVIG